MKWANVYPTVEMIKQKVNRRENINNKKDIKMRKNILSTAFAVVIMAIAGYNVYLNQTKSNLSDLALANIEALADDKPEVEMQKCTRAVLTGNCYLKSDNTWHSIYVKTVEEYEVPKYSIYICEHTKVSTCPSYTYAAN